MTQLTWEAMNPIDTSRYLDAIQKAQAQSVAGVEQIGNAYKGYQDNLKKQNTNDMLTALNQAKNPEQLAIAQANIAAMQQRWGSGYDMDAVRTAMDERPAVLMERDSKALQHQQEKARYEAIPQINEAAAKFSAGRNGVTPEMAQQLNTLAALGIDASGTINSLATSANSDYTTERDFAYKNYWDLKKFNQDAYEFGAKLNQGAYQYNRTATREEQESALRMGETLYKADQTSGAGTVSVAPDGTEFTTGGGGGAAKLARLASMSMPAPVRQAVFQGESGGDYDTLYGNSQRAGGRFAGVKLTNMTVNEALEFSKAGGDYAQWSKTQKGVKPGTYATPMGAWQVVGTTLETAAKALGLKGNEKMTPELQDKIGDYIYQTQGTNAWEGYRGPVQGGGGYKPGNAVSNAPATAPLVGIDRKVQQKIRGEYQNAMLKYNENLALKDQPVNVGNVLAGLTTKEKGSFRNQDSFDIADAIKSNPQVKGISAEGVTNVYNKAKSWQAKPNVPIIGYNSSDGLKKSIDTFIKEEIGIDAKRKEHVAKASHPSNTYVQKIQQEFEANGVSISAKEALLHIDPTRYQSLYGKPTVKVQEALDKKVDKAAATTPPPASKGKGTPAATKTTPVVNTESKKAAETSKQAANLNLRPYDKLVLKFSDQKTKAEFDKEYEQIKQSEQKAIQARKAADAAKKAQKLREVAEEKRKVADILVKRAREEAARKAEEELRLAKHRQARQARQYPAPSDEWLKSAQERLKQNR